MDAVPVAPDDSTTPFGETATSIHVRRWHIVTMIDFSKLLSGFAIHA